MLASRSAATHVVTRQLGHRHIPPARPGLPPGVQHDAVVIRPLQPALIVIAAIVVTTAQRIAAGG